MRKIVILSFYLVFSLYNSQISAQEITNIAIEEDRTEMKITILYDNYVFKEGTKADWGFACLIENSDHTILFDTGAKEDILMHNIKSLNVNIFEIDAIVISHNHWDHTGGLNAILKLNSDLNLYMPCSTDPREIDRMSRTGANVIMVKEPKEIIEGIYLTGEMGDDIREQSLIIDSPQGIIVITGCSHPGIINILKKAKQIMDKNIYLVTGGFHLHRKTEEEIDDIINYFKSMGVKRCGCSHCSGEKTIGKFNETYADNFIKIGTGKVISLDY
ncbi:MAG: MBL fold metallo-hydrolase [Calditrichaceae bacterium]|jgi:7,8-dihydropterin-6-yl-methyl-4-(beta-D-ribofuranosyl)aminobenzene 5'-phosphate synthase